MTTLKSNSNHNKIEGLNLVRLMCCLGVIAYHYSVHAKLGSKIFLANSNSSWGGVMVGIFFMLSGGLLYVNYSNIQNLYIYFKKRFLSIYPAFYIAFAFMFMSTVYARGQVFWSGKPVLLLLSALGMDGYFNYLFPSNYYILGEWFLGALIFLYILYPLIVKLVNKFNFYFLILYSILYIIFLKFSYLFTINASQNLISCIMSFILGIYIFKYRNYIFNKRNFMPALIIFFISIVIHFPLPSDLLIKISAISLFIVLQQIGILLDQTFLKKPIAWTSSLTYEVFLLQHLIIVRVLLVKDFDSLLNSVLLLFITTVLIFIYAKGLNVLAKELKKYIAQILEFFDRKIKKM